MALLSTPCIVLVSTDVHKLVLLSRIPNFELNFRLLWRVADSHSQVNKGLRVSLASTFSVTWKPISGQLKS